MQDTFTQMVNKLDARIAQMTEEYLVGIMKNLDKDHNLSFERRALKRATCEALTFMIDDEESKEVFEAAVIKMATSGSMVKEIAKVLVTEE